MEQLVQAWGDMADTIEDRAERLASAHEIHTFYEQCETTAARIGEKSVVASRTDYGDVLAAVESLIAEHKVFEIDLEAVRKRVTDLAAECSALQSKFPQKEAELADKLTSVNEAWAKLQELTAARRAALTQSLHFERFVVNHARVLDWVNDVIRQIEDTVPSDEVDQAEELTQEHGKLKAEIDARASDVQDVVTEGAELMDNYEPLEPKVKSMLDNLSGRESMMRSLWEQTDKVLRETSEGLSFERETHQAMALLKSTQERLDAATLDPSKSSSAEILELMAAVNALERSIQVRFLSLRCLKISSFSSHLVALERSNPVTVPLTQHWRVTSAKPRCFHLPSAFANHLRLSVNSGGPNCVPHTPPFLGGCVLSMLNCVPHTPPSPSRWVRALYATLVSACSQFCVHAHFSRPTPTAL